MRIYYDPDSDSLYIRFLELSTSINSESEEVAPGVVLDFGANNRVVGIEIDNASTMVDLNKLEADCLLKTSKLSA